jgi:hypothetical protein
MLRIIGYLFVVLLLLILLVLIVALTRVLTNILDSQCECVQTVRQGSGL